MKCFITLKDNRHWGKNIFRLRKWKWRRKGVDQEKEILIKYYKSLQYIDRENLLAVSWISVCCRYLGATVTKKTHNLKGIAILLNIKWFLHCIYQLFAYLLLTGYSIADINAININDDQSWCGWWSTCKKYFFRISWSSFVLIFSLFFWWIKESGKLNIQLFSSWFLVASPNKDKIHSLKTG